MFRAFQKLRRRAALVLCPELAEVMMADATVPLPSSVEYIDVEVQADHDGPWLRAQIVSGSLHWVQGPMGTTAAKHLEAVRAEFVRANHEVPAAIDAALQAADQRFPVEVTRPAFRVLRDGGPSAFGAKLRFRFPRSALQGDW